MESNKRTQTICIVGRPNVGKSSLFNCLLGERRSVTLEQSGTTRDRVEAVMRLGRNAVRLVDTGGFEAGEKDEISVQVKEQIFKAMEEADSVIMVVDSMDGLTGADMEVASILRKFNKQVKIVANKADNENIAFSLYDFYSLGFGEPEAVSCIHRRGIKKLKNHLLEQVKKSGKPEFEESGEILKIAIVGRPNVGKSSFVNSLLSRKHAVVSDIPGTTRDSIDTFFTLDGSRYMLIDTAGIRHKRKVKTAVDTFSMMRSHDAVKRSDVVILVLDAKDGITKDDLMILDHIEESGKGCLIAVNKWDLSEGVEGVSAEEYRKGLTYAAERLGRYPVVFVSSTTGKNVPACLPILKTLNANLDIKASTPFLNKIFEKADPSRVSIPRKLKRPNFLYLVQSGSRPVEFRYFVSDPANVIPAHESFIENRLRENLPLTGIPIKLTFVRSRKDRGESAKK
ncbi:MAG TPA: ribosome biogenesis GTPase Der [Candidatus Omnitrophota bacterium]|nr:ribosome biogenesis GTPase Der [Candidatus Omnitrophota bacterium]